MEFQQELAEALAREYENLDSADHEYDEGDVVTTIETVRNDFKTIKDEVDSITVRVNAVVAVDGIKDLTYIYEAKSSLATWNGICTMPNPALLNIINMFFSVSCVNCILKVALRTFNMN